MVLPALEDAALDKKNLKTVDDLVGYLKVECCLTDEFIGEFKYAQLRRLYDHYRQLYEEENKTAPDDDIVPAAPPDIISSHEGRAQSMDSGYGTTRADTAEKLYSEILGVSKTFRIRHFLARPVDAFCSRRVLLLM